MMYSYGPPHMAGQKRDDQIEHTYSSYVRIRYVAQRPARGNERKGDVARDGQGYPCLRHDMNLMMNRVSKVLLKRLEDLEIRPRVETIQTTTLLRTARILR